MDFDKYKMSRTHHYSITQKSFNYCAPVINPSLSSPQRFATTFFKTLFTWSHAVCNLRRLTSFTLQYKFKIPPTLSWLGSSLFLLTIIPMYGCTTTCWPIHLLKKILVLPDFVNYEYSCYKHSHAGFPVDVNF